MFTVTRGTEVFVVTGYCDSQMHLQGFLGEVVAETGGRFLVRDPRGEVTSCTRDELQPPPTSRPRA
ncbi:hypothetical protein [Motiliproteus sp. SC1-56]|uniref:hypothetical protein n=1 Tax=Motiliproteus sp. SC1-56 TaxID=2799565 RepID=UPI001A9021D2|nr:hypothetical protein [Motiliproteus sp. SC1-56]